MKRKTIALASTLVVAATAAVAQVGPAPDFSPMQPRLADPNATSTYELNTSTSSLPVQTDNRMLQGYESSNLLPGEPAPPPVAIESSVAEPVYVTPGPAATGPRVAIVPLAPSQSTIGNGLFNRRGPNDFGA